MSSYELILFDIGGLFMKLGGMPIFMEWTGMEPEAIMHGWLSDENVIAYETGKVDTPAFAEQLVSDWQLPVDRDTLVAEMRSWPGLYPGSIEFLNKVREKIPIACLTNMNPLQWPTFSQKTGLGDCFNHQFVSYEIGFVKPFREAYDYVLTSLDLAPESILFFDDCLPNVEAGQTIGMECYHVKDIASMQVILQEKGMF